MGLFDMFRRPPPPETKASQAAVATVTATHQLGRPVWSATDYEAFARNSYMLNPIGFRCVKLIATAVANIPLLAFRDGDELEDGHEILDLLNRPSFFQSGVQLREQFFTYLLLSGNGYLESVGPSTRRPPSELYALRPDRMKIVPSRFGVPMAYEYRHGSVTKSWPSNPRTGESDILHIKEFHPLDDWYGLSRAMPAARSVDSNNMATEHNKSLLDHGATPSGALIFEPVKSASGAMESAPQQVIENAEKRIADRHSGPKNAGRPMVFGGSVKWEEMGLSPRDMNFGETKLDAARDICVAWGVPPMLLIKGESTYNNRKEAKLEFYEETVLPLLGLGLSGLNTWIQPRYEENLTLQPDLDSISALEPRRESKRNSVVELLDKEVITADEAREALQYGPRPPSAVANVDPAVLTALVNAVDIVGIEPLARYMRGVGLVDRARTDEEILSMALDVIEDDEENIVDQDVEADEDLEDDEG